MIKSCCCFFRLFFFFAIYVDLLKYVCIESILKIIIFHWLSLTHKYIHLYVFRVLHMRSLDTIFKILYLSFAAKSFAKFRFQCFRGKPSKLTGKKGGALSTVDHTGQVLSARQLASRGLGTKVRKSHVHYIEEDATNDGGDSTTTSLGSSLLQDSSSGGLLQEIGEAKPNYMSPADEQVMHVMKGRESLLDELRYTHYLYDN